jgi:hypothetical protein
MAKWHPLSGAFGRDSGREQKRCLFRTGKKSSRYILEYKATNSSEWKSRLLMLPG